MSLDSEGLDPGVEMILWLLALIVGAVAMLGAFYLVRKWLQRQAHKRFIRDCMKAAEPDLEAVPKVAVSFPLSFQNRGFSPQINIMQSPTPAKQVVSQKSVSKQAERKLALENKLPSMQATAVKGNAMRPSERNSSESPNFHPLTQDLRSVGRSMPEAINPPTIHKPPQGVSCSPVVEPVGKVTVGRGFAAARKPPMQVPATSSTAAAPVVNRAPATAQSRPMAHGSLIADISPFSPLDTVVGGSSLPSSRSAAAGPVGRGLPSGSGIQRVAPPASSSIGAPSNDATTWKQQTQHVQGRGAHGQQDSRPQLQRYDTMPSQSRVPASNEEVMARARNAIGSTSLRGAGSSGSSPQVPQVPRQLPAPNYGPGLHSHDTNLPRRAASEEGEAHPMVGPPPLPEGVTLRQSGQSWRSARAAQSATEALPLKSNRR
jgi:hypothetical protein